MTVGQDPAPAGPAQTGHHVQQGGLARAVGAEQSREGARLAEQVDVLDDGAAVDLPADRLDVAPHAVLLLPGHDDSRWRRRRNAKKGDPITPVTTPTGISPPSKADRAISSAQTRQIAPRSAYRPVGKEGV